jgi:Ni,Fe-hydrogenase III large subunit
VEDDVAPEQSRKLRELVEKLRVEVERVEAEITLDTAVRSRKRSIAARISSAIIDLEEVGGSGLRGYGEVPKEIEQALAGKFARLISVLQEMERIAESKDAHS